MWGGGEVQEPGSATGGSLGREPGARPLLPRLHTGPPPHTARTGHSVLPPGLPLYWMHPVLLRVGGGGGPLGVWLSG